MCEPKAMSRFSPPSCASFASCSFVLRSNRRDLSTFIACARFLCCERSFWQETTIPVGRCVTRIAEAGTLTCWPPAPLGRQGASRARAARLGDQQAVGVVAVDRERRALDAGLVARLHVEHFALEVAPLRP